jgi:hypothetical protein
VKLLECQQLVKNDFFLQKFEEKFMHEARMLICEMYCTINRKVDLSYCYTYYALVILIILLFYLNTLTLTRWTSTCWPRSCS